MRVGNPQRHRGAIGVPDEVQWSRGRQQRFERRGFVGERESARLAPWARVAMAIQVAGEHLEPRREALGEAAVLARAAGEGMNAKHRGPAQRCTHQRLSSTCAMRRAARAAPSVSTRL